MKKVPNNILAEGEVTGHIHRVNVDVWEKDGIKTFSGSTLVEHEEHKPILLEENEWASDKVLETDHLTGLSRQVQD